MDIGEAVEREHRSKRPEDVRVPVVAWLDGYGTIHLEQAGEDPFPDRSQQTIKNLRAVAERLEFLAGRGR